MQRFKALWEAIGPYTQESLTFHMGQLAKATFRGHDNERIDAVAIIEIILYRAVATEVSVILRVSPFMTMLREASISTLTAMLASAENEPRVVVQGIKDMSICTTNSGSTSTSDGASDSWGQNNRLSFPHASLDLSEMSNH